MIHVPEDEYMYTFFQLYCIGSNVFFAKSNSLGLYFYFFNMCL